jgi:hypothetical protein
MTDYSEGIKKEVAEIKFLIHDLRVERFINEIIHFHVTVNTDLEIYSVEQAQILHGEDLQALKAKAVQLRKALHDYSNAVKNFSPDRTILQAGYHYVETIRSICELILNPLWGRIDKVLVFLPPESRSVRSRELYRNCTRWIGGVFRRIRHFLHEQEGKDVYEEFDIAEEIENFTGDVIDGYVKEKGGARVRLHLGRLDPVAIGGNRYRFRRMYFNLVMNSVDAVANRKVGVLNISASEEEDRVLLRVRDNGVGMPPEKIEQLLKDRETLDGELHSLGFVFVRQTVAEFGGEISIESELGEGTVMALSLPRLPGRTAAPRPPSGHREDDRLFEPEGTLGDASAGPAETEGETPAGAALGGVNSFRAAMMGEGAGASASAAAASDRDSSCGQMIYEDYKNSGAQYPGSIFGIAVGEDDDIEFFTHRPYDRYSNVGHEDLSPMCYESTMRGRLEEDDLKRPLLIFKEPRSVRDYFDFKNVPEQERGPAKHVQMVHDEYIRIARKLIDTGMPPETRAELTGLRKFFPGQTELPKRGPFPLGLLARQALSSEQGE